VNYEVHLWQKWVEDGQTLALVI